MIRTASVTGVKTGKNRKQQIQALYNLIAKFDNIVLLFLQILNM